MRRVETIWPWTYPISLVRRRVRRRCVHAEPETGEKKGKRGERNIVKDFEEAKTGAHLLAGAKAAGQKLPTYKTPRR